MNEDQIGSARKLCTQLMEQFEAMILHTPRANTRLLPIAFAWANQVHRFVHAALILHDRGHGQETLVLQRQALEFAVRLHWLTQIGDSAVDSVLADHKQSIKTLAADASGGELGLPQDFLDELGEVSVDATYAFGKFREACDVLGIVESLYILYRHLSQYTHPTWASAASYINEDKGQGWAVRNIPKNAWVEGPTMLAALLIWSTRSVDDLISGKPERQKLRQSARKLGVRSVLPEFQKPPRKTKPKKTD